MNKQELIDKYEDKLKDVQLKFGANFKTKVYEGLVEDLQQLDEPKKPAVPQFVADWIEYCKKHNFTLFGCLDPVNGFESLADEIFEGDIRKCIRWCRKESNNFARAWLDGYELEEEKRYYVRFKFIEDSYSYLTLIKHLNAWTLTEIKTDKKFRTEHTKIQLEEAGFGWVFDCPGVEVEEVEG